MNLQQRSSMHFASVIRQLKIALPGVALSFAAVLGCQQRIEKPPGQCRSYPQLNGVKLMRLEPRRSIDRIYAVLPNLVVNPVTSVAQGDRMITLSIRGGEIAVDEIPIQSRDRMPFFVKEFEVRKGLRDISVLLLADYGAQRKCFEEYRVVNDRMIFERRHCDHLIIGANDFVWVDPTNIIVATQTGYADPLNQVHSSSSTAGLWTMNLANGSSQILALGNYEQIEYDEKTATLIGVSDGSHQIETWKVGSNMELTWINKQELESSAGRLHDQGNSQVVMIEGSIPARIPYRKISPAKSKFVSIKTFSIIDMDLQSPVVQGMMPIISDVILRPQDIIMVSPTAPLLHCQL